MTTKHAIAWGIANGMVKLPAPTTKSAEAIKVQIKRQKKSRYYIPPIKHTLHEN